MKTDSFDRVMRAAFPDSDLIKRLFGGSEPKPISALPWRELVNTRHELQGLERSIADKLDQDKRDATDDEVTAIDHIGRTIDHYRREMDFRDLLGSREPRDVRIGRMPPSGAATRTLEDMRAAGARRPDSHSFIDAETGRYIRVLRHDERMADSDGWRGEEPRLLNVGHVAARILRGTWASEAVAEEARALQIGVDASGGFMVPHPISSRVIDYARAQSVCMQAGVGTIDMPSATLDLSRIESDPVLDWKAELAPATPGQPTIGRVRLQARTVMCIIPVSGELLQDATPNLSQTLEQLIVRALASELDRVILVGAAANQEPVGIKNTSGINSIAVGAALDGYGPFSGAVQRVRESNHEPNALVTSPAVLGTLDRLEDSTGQPLRAPASYEQLARFSTTNVATGGTPAASDAYVGKWNEALLGVRLGLTIRAANDGVLGSLNLTESYAVGIVAVGRFDFVAMRPKAFCLVSGMQTS